MLSDFVCQLALCK